MNSENSGNKLLYERESYLLRGACFRLYHHFGGAFKESVIHKSLVFELKRLGLTVESHKVITVYYGDQKVGTYIPDLILEDKVLIELKAKAVLTTEDYRQFWHYLRASNYHLGFLINFGFSNLEIIRRIYHPFKKVPSV